MAKREVGQAVMPPHPRNALELLKTREGRVEPWINKYWAGGIGAFTGFICGIGSNKFVRRPWTAGMHISILSSIGFGAICHYIGKWRAEYMAERDAIIRHYIELHSEDFELPERRKYGELFEKWLPNR